MWGNFFIRQQILIRFCNATSQILLVCTYVKRNLILSSTKEKLAKSDVYYKRHDHLKMKYFTVFRISNFVVLCLFFVPIDRKQVKINIPPFFGSMISKMYL